MSGGLLASALPHKTHTYYIYHEDTKTAMNESSPTHRRCCTLTTRLARITRSSRSRALMSTRCDHIVLSLLTNQRSEVQHANKLALLAYHACGTFIHGPARPISHMRAGAETNLGSGGLGRNKARNKGTVHACLKGAKRGVFYYWLGQVIYKD